MEPDHGHISLRRPAAVTLAAALLVAVTVALGATLGFLTQSQFSQISQSWTNYSQGAERKGILLSEIRGHLGYGGIIHNFKNFVLRQDEGYLVQTVALIDAFDATIGQLEALHLSADERTAIATITNTIRQYEAALPTAIEAAGADWPVEKTDMLVRVDDTAAIAALGDLNQLWRADQQASAARLLNAVGQGRQLIRYGFASIFALVLAAMVVGWLLFVLVRDLRMAVGELASELKERRRLERSEGRLAAAVEQSPATIIITDTRARIQYVNKKFTDLTGWTLQEVLGRTPAFLQSGATTDKTYEDIRNDVARGQSWHGIFQNRKKDGSSYWAETTILPLLSPDGAVQNYIGVSEDITEKRQARDQVVRAQKLEAVGQLAGGVAHDFNNILTTIVGAAHLAMMDAEDDSDLAGEITQIDIAARRAQSLVRGLLTFARREPGEQKPVNVSAMIDEVIGLLHASIPPMIRIEHTGDAEGIHVLGDQTHLHQIIMNLCRNAAEAMAGSAGQITASAQRCETPARERGCPEGWVKLTVSDDGPGMSEDTKRHLFEPFFTTKPIGKGSGLGLSVVYGLVDEMGGRISVESSLGIGSVFTIILPGAHKLDEQTEPADLPIARGTERLILIDDEAEVVGTFRRLLLRLGYQVEAFTSPVVALERFRAEPDRFDLVVSDMVMPDMSGEDLARQLRDLRPTVPIIFCSAYKSGHIDLPGPAPQMLDKPVQPNVLASTIRVHLDQPSH